MSYGGINDQPNQLQTTQAQVCSFSRTQNLLFFVNFYETPFRDQNHESTRI